MLQTSSDYQTFTYQTRPILNGEELPILTAYASLMSLIERKLFALLVSGHSATQLKSEFLRRFDITARQFNAIRVQLEGKIASVKEVRENRIETLKGQIKSIESSLKKMRQKQDKAFVIHQKTRRVAILKTRLARLEQDKAEGRIRLCFGSRKKFHAQHDLAANGYASHQEWKDDWTKTRSSSFFLIGSKDETSGNQSCVASLAEDESITLRLRLPNALSQYGKYLVLPNIVFPYGHDVITSALRKNLQGENPVAISYRFILDEKGYRVFVSLPVQKPQRVSQQNVGVIGLDINADHLALVETDRFLNPIRKETVPLCTYGASKNQTKARIGDAVKKVIQLCQQAKKPLVIEKLSFGKKKCTLRESGARYARMLSSFVYSSITAHVKSRAFRCGICVHEVNPAYTSLIGRVKFMKRYGLSVHHSAALCIARRCLGGSERLPRHETKVYDGKGGHVTLSVPVRNRNEHVWTSWRAVRKELLAAHVAHPKTHKRSSGSASAHLL